MTLCIFCDTQQRLDMDAGAEPTVAGDIVIALGIVC